MSKKTIDEVIDRSFEERAAKFQEEIVPICEKWQVMPWAGLMTTNESLTAVPQLKDLKEKKDT